MFMPLPATFLRWHLLVSKAKLCTISKWQIWSSLMMCCIPGMCWDPACWSTCLSTQIYVNPSCRGARSNLLAVPTPRKGVQTRYRKNRLMDYNSMAKRGMELVLFTSEPQWCKLYMRSIQTKYKNINYYKLIFEFRGVYMFDAMGDGRVTS